jgi:hypothetical protein
VQRHPVDEEYNKLTSFICANARVGVGFTGVATTPTGFNTAEWLLVALMEAARRVRSYSDRRAAARCQARTRFEGLGAKRYSPVRPATVRPSGGLLKQRRPARAIRDRALEALNRVGGPRGGLGDRQAVRMHRDPERAIRGDHD